MKKAAIVVSIVLLTAGCQAKHDSGAQKIKNGSRQVAQGVKEEAQKLAKKAEAAGKKIKQDVKEKTDTHR